MHTIKKYTINSHEFLLIHGMNTESIEFYATELKKVADNRQFEAIKRLHKVGDELAENIGFQHKELNNWLIQDFGENYKKSDIYLLKIHSNILTS